MGYDVSIRNGFWADGECIAVNPKTGELEGGQDHRSHYGKAARLLRRKRPQEKPGSALVTQGPANLVTAFSQNFFLISVQNCTSFSSAAKLIIWPCVIGDVFGVEE